METDGFLNEFSFQCHNHFFERREGASDKMMQWSNLRTRTDGMVAGNKSSPANSNNGLPRSERGKGGREKGPHFDSLPPSLSSIISRRHLTILKIPERLHISLYRTSTREAARRFLLPLQTTSTRSPRLD